MPAGLPCLALLGRPVEEMAELSSEVLTPKDPPTRVMGLLEAWVDHLTILNRLVEIGHFKEMGRIL